MKWIDLPPVWLFVMLVVAWLAPWRWDVPGGTVLGIGLLVIAAVLVGAALFEFAKAKTTVIPGQHPTAMIDGGVFGLSRNPIYLADVLILAGLSLHWGSLVGACLVPVLAVTLQRRFILGEEARLAAKFGYAYEAYRNRVRRWL